MTQRQSHSTNALLTAGVIPANEQVTSNRDVDPAKFNILSQTSNNLNSGSSPNKPSMNNGSLGSGVGGHLTIQSRLQNSASAHKMPQHSRKSTPTNNTPTISKSNIKILSATQSNLGGSLTARGGGISQSNSTSNLNVMRNTAGSNASSFIISSTVADMAASSSR
jgi:hypothetical protein